MPPSPRLVPTLFGAGWEETVKLVPIVAVVGIFGALETGTGAIFLAKQRPDIGFKFAVFTLVTAVPAFALAAQQSVMAVAAVGAALMIVFFLARRVVLWRLNRTSPSVEYLHAVTGALTLSAGAVAAVLALDQLLPSDAFGSAPARLVVLGCTFVVTFVVLTATFQRTYVASLWTLLTSRASSEAAPSA